MVSNYNNNLYKEYEKLIEENKKLKNENKNLKLEICILKSEQENNLNKFNRDIEKLNKKHKDEIGSLNIKYNNLLKEIERLKTELSKNYENKYEVDKDYIIDKLTNQVSKDSTNSSIPTSKEIKHRRTNTYNHRKTSEKHTGAQFYHKGITLTKEKMEDKIKQSNLEIREVKHYVDAKKYNENKVKYRIGIEIKAYVEKHIFIPFNKSKEILPKEFHSDVTYDNSIKSIVVLLGNYCSMPYNKIKELIASFTGNLINISEGTIDNIYENFSNKSDDTLLNIVNNILNFKSQHTDETVTKENGKDTYYRGYGNKENVYFTYHHHKGDNPIKEDNILPRFYGTIISDHEVGIFKYGTNNQDCIVHFGRYCIEHDQNIITTWQMRLYLLLLRFEINRRILIKFGATEFSKEDIKYMEEQFDKILNFAKKENEFIQSTYWKEKANTLMNRCIKYKNQMLFYIHDFTVDYDNNFMERALRMIKNKTKVSGGFRSKNGGIRFGKTMSIIKTSILRNMNPFESIKSIMNGEILFA